MFADRVKTPIADQFTLRRRQGDVGIELEVEGDNLPAGGVTNDFLGKADGSLRNGMEYISGILRRKDVKTSVDTLFTTLHKNGVRLVPSYRCSTHIHENYLDHTFGEVLGAYICWAMIEPAVFRVLPAGRDGSLFCVSSYDSGDLPLFFERFCEGIANGFLHGWNPRGKYSSLNISRLGPSDAPALGTLEYRVFPLSTNGQTVQEWSDWLGNIKTFVKQHYLEDPTFVSMVRWAEANPIRFVETIIGNKVLHFTFEETRALVDFGVRQGYELARIVAAAMNAKPKRKGVKTVGLDGPMIDVVVGDVGEAIPAAPVNPFPWGQRPLNRRRRAAAAGNLGDAGAEPARRAGPGLGDILGAGLNNPRARGVR